MSADFDDIEIVDLDVAKTTWSRVHSSMRTVYLKLSREPDAAWTRHFLEERGKRMNPKRHGLWIEDSYIVIDCFVDEVESHHLPDVRQSVAYANRKCQEQVNRRREQAEEAREETRAEQQALDALRARIRAAAPKTDTTAPPEATTADRTGAGATDAETEPAFAKKRDDWQARFRAALAFRKKEPTRGND